MKKQAKDLEMAAKFSFPKIWKSRWENGAKPFFVVVETFSKKTSFN